MATAKMSPEQYKAYIAIVQKHQADLRLQHHTHRRECYLLTESVKLRAQLRDFSTELKNEDLIPLQLKLKYMINDNSPRFSHDYELRLTRINEQIRTVEDIRCKAFEILFNLGFVFMPDGTLKPR